MARKGHLDGIRTDLRGTIRMHEVVRFLGRRIWTKSQRQSIDSIHSNSKWTIASGVIYDVRDAVCWDGRSPSTVFRGFVHSVRTE